MDLVGPEKPPTTEELCGSEPSVNRYAVPLGTLVGGAFVAQEDHVVIHPQPGGHDAGFASGGLVPADGDGD